ncbi:MAG TPA: hypothetical protein VGI39_23475 [Polyangiaceae bacterium]|jgi:hypothetical protein
MLRADVGPALSLSRSSSRASGLREGRSLSFAFGTTLTALVLGGCTGQISPSPEAADADANSTATAVVVVEGTLANEGSRSEAVARFVRAHGGTVDDDVLRMVGAVVDFPALGSCGPVVAQRAANPASPHWVSLVDVGSVALIAGDSSTLLSRRQLPDVADFVSGVVYSGRGSALAPRGGYELRIDGTGDPDVPAFHVTANAPGEPSDVRIAGDDGRSGAVNLALATSNVDVAWEPGSAYDLVYVDVSAASAAPSARCLFRDDGHASIPASAFGAIEDGTLAVHRLHREAFHARGVDPGEVRFDFARVVSFARR